ncbi:hypothetical protein [Mucilaginibacter antarcticus]|uniref:hypothetical protein n=1 Tax=Mucilaginibacter antarcticus TaxID=1855725 RepID=UPI0036396DC4
MNLELNNKVIKKVLKIALGIVLFLLLTVSIALLLFQYKPVQTWAAKKATAYLSKNWRLRLISRAFISNPLQPLS